RSFMSNSYSMETRLQKILAHAGYGSRRSCEELILDGRVVVNGEIASLGMKADPDLDKISVDGKPLQSPEKKLYIMLHKPKGVLSTVSSPDKRPTVRSLVNRPGRLYPVGRLDLISEGLILMTNDGELTHQLTHPSFEHEKEYRVLVRPTPQKNQLGAWSKGIMLDDGTITKPAQVWIERKDADVAWLGVILKEGKKRQIRRMAESSGLVVLRLIRIRIGSLVLGDLLPGEWRELTADEITQLQDLIKE
ncbi:MAG: rRNA pseudouridine synthase, partial [Anaerolineales bacterium]|nr:rRNA pseudouridine synthase [Anaerolineales bacterium]